MSKKLISLLLTVMLGVSMIAVAGVSVSAEVDDEGRYTPSSGIDTYRYYFYMPSDWYNDCAFRGGIYWWEGTDAAKAWPGYGAQDGDVNHIYYCDVPTNIGTIIWNNGYDGGSDETDPDYAKAIQTVNIQSECCADGDTDLYDTSWFEEMEERYKSDKTALGDFAGNFFYYDDTDFSFNYDNMIFVVNPDRTSINSYNGKITSGGDWYFYYGNGEYGTYPLKDEAAKKGQLFNTDYQPPKYPATSEADTTAETTEVVETTQQASTESTSATDVSEPEETIPNLVLNATSNYFPKATAEYNKSTKEVTVTYWMKSNMNVLDVQWYATYDSDILSVSEKNNEESICPAIGSYSVCNTKLKNIIKYNATNLNLFDFSSVETPFVQLVFDVNDLKGKAPANTTVDLTVEVLRVSQLNEDTGRSDDTKEICIVNNSEVLNNNLTAAAGIKTRTELTPSTFIEPTTTVVTEASSSVVEPMETTTVESTTKEQIVTTEQAESTTAGKSTKDSVSTSDSPSSSNNAVQTGDTSLAVIILSIIIAATCVMFVLRKREML